MNLKDTLNQLLGGATPASIQCVFTREEAESIEVCSNLQEATYVSIYVRDTVGEVVPVGDFPVISGNYDKDLVVDSIAAIRKVLGDLPLESNGALL